MLKIYIYGAGTYGQAVRNLLREKVDIVGFTDSNSEKYNNRLDGLAIFSPNCLEAEDYDYVIIASMYALEIHKALESIKRLQQRPHKIIDANDAIQLILLYCMAGKQTAVDVSTHSCDLHASIYSVATMYKDIGQRNKYVQLISNLAKFCHKDSAFFALHQKLLQSQANCEKKLIDDHLQQQSLEKLEYNRKKAHEALIGNEQERPESILFIAVGLAAGYFIAQSLCKRLGMHYGSFTNHVYPGGTIIFEALLKFLKQGSVSHTHADPSDNNIGFLRAASVRRLIVHFRDPRSAVLSFTHHVGVSSDPARVWYYHPLMNIPQTFFTQKFAWQLDYMIEHYLPICMDWISGWDTIYQSGEFDMLITTFEAFKTNSTAFFTKILKHYDIPLDRFSPAKLPEKQGDYYLRKGALTEWRERCTKEQIKKIMNQIPDDYYARFNWPTE